MYFFYFLNRRGLYDTGRFFRSFVLFIMYHRCIGSFIGCGIVIFVRRKHKYDCINILSGVLMAVCFFVLLFLLWCVIGFGSNVPNAEPKPSGYYEVWNGTGNRTTIIKKNEHISSSHIYEQMR